MSSPPDHIAGYLMLKIGSLLTRPPIPLVAVCRRGGAMADWEAKFSKEKKGIIVVVVNKSTEKWSKSQEARMLLAHW